MYMRAGRFELYAGRDQCIRPAGSKSYWFYRTKGHAHTSWQALLFGYEVVISIGNKDKPAASC